MAASNFSCERRTNSTASRTAPRTALVIGDVVRLVFHFFARVANGDGKPAISHDGQVDYVVADVSDLVRAQVIFLKDFAENESLSAMPW